MRSRQKSNPTHQQISWHLGIINAVHVLLLCFLSSNVVDPEKSLHISDASSNSSHLRKICCLPGRRDMGNRQIRHEQLPSSFGEFFVQSFLIGEATKPRLFLVGLWDLRMWWSKHLSNRKRQQVTVSKNLPQLFPGVPHSSQGPSSVNPTPRIKLLFNGAHCEEAMYLKPDDE